MARMAKKHNELCDFAHKLRKKNNKVVLTLPKYLIPNGFGKRPDIKILFKYEEILKVLQQMKVLPILTHATKSSGFLQRLCIEND
jgi:hypothetical protein